MKIVPFAEKLLKEIATEYKDNEKKVFDIDFFKDKRRIQSEDYIYTALATLKDDGFIKVFYADDAPYTITLLPQGIVEAEENTMIKKGYKAIKEIKSLITL